jgi:hypothetical protein
MIELGLLKRRAGFKDVYRFLGIDVAIRSDDRRLLDDFRKVYRRFAIEDSSSEKLSFWILSAAAGPGRCCLIAGEKLFVLESPAVVPHLYFFLFNFITEEVRDYFIIHAGVVALGGRGILVSAPSMVGKTTLIFSLVLKGFEFLSDELAPIHRKSLLIEPFPRSIGLRFRALALFPGLKERAKGLVTVETPEESKVMVDVEAEGLARVAGPCRPAVVIFLEPQLEQQDGEPSHRYLELSLNTLPDAFLGKLRTIPGVVDAARLADRDIPTCRLTLEKKARIVKELDSLCAAEGILVSRSIPGATRPPDYSRPPALRPIEKKEGLLELARNLQGGPQSKLFEAHGGSPSRLLFELAEVARDVDFFAMRVGRLEEMTDLIWELARRKT